MSAHVSAGVPLFTAPARATAEQPDERTQVAAAMAYLLAFGVAVPAALLVALLTLLDPAHPAPDAAAASPVESACAAPAAGVGDGAAVR
jgi:hypothetical protein